MYQSSSARSASSRSRSASASWRERSGRHRLADPVDQRDDGLEVRAPRTPAPRPWPSRAAARPRAPASRPPPPGAAPRARAGPRPRGPRPGARGPSAGRRAQAKRTTSAPSSSAAPRRLEQRERGGEHDRAAAPVHVDDELVADLLERHVAALGERQREPHVAVAVAEPELAREPAVQQRGGVRLREHRGRRAGRASPRRAPRLEVRRRSTGTGAKPVADPAELGLLALAPGAEVGPVELGGEDPVHDRRHR